MKTSWHIMTNSMSKLNFLSRFARYPHGGVCSKTTNTPRPTSVQTGQLQTTTVFLQVKTWWHGDMVFFLMFSAWRSLVATWCHGNCVARLGKKQLMLQAQAQQVCWRKTFWPFFLIEFSNCHQVDKRSCLFETVWYGCFDFLPKIGSLVNWFHHAID